MDLKSDNELDSGPRFCTPLASDAIDMAIHRAFPYEDEIDAVQTGLAPYDLKFSGPFYSALQLGEMMLSHLGSRTFEEDMIMATKWDRAL